MAMIGNFNIYEGELFKAFFTSGNGELNTTQIQEKSVEGIREAIDARNEWCKERNGFAEKFCIVRVTWNKIYYMDGTFRESHETKTTVEIYPKEI